MTSFLYNPDRKDKRQLIAEFVVRNEVLADIMDDLENSSMETPEQHYLLVGQRGTGKTTMLNRIKYAIEDSPKLKDRLIPIIFNEEQYNVGELANLWENVAQILEDYYGFNGLYEKMERHVVKNNFEEICWDILVEDLDKKDKKIVLLIDNIGDLFKKIGELEIRRLRELLQTKPQIRVIAASPFYLESILDYKQPMFEFFKVIRLEGLSQGETQKLLLKLGEIEHEREKIESIIKGSPGRIETLRTLTGGVPRTIALMFNIFIENEHESSLKDLEKILDNVTPLYKHRMDDLPAQQQKIVDAVARNWDPISVKELKEKVRLEGKVISAQLRQLEKNQVIQKLGTNTKNHEYILRERFLNIWYLMRYGRRDDKQRVIWLVRFLESWCTDEEIESRITSFVEEIRCKKIESYNIDFFAEVYSSVNKLTLKAKLLLQDNTPSKYGKAIPFTKEEMNSLVNENFHANNYKRTLELLSSLDQLSDSDELLVLDIIIKIMEINEDVGVYFHDISSLLIDKLKSRATPSAGLWRLYMIFLIVTFYFQISFELRNDELESALTILESQLGAVAQTVSQFGNGNYLWDFKIELRLLLSSIKLFLRRGQNHSLIKIFKEGFSEMENIRIPFSEIFNPIYLGLNSLNPDTKAGNLAPEKEEVVRQVKDYLTKRN